MGRKGEVTEEECKEKGVEALCRQLQSVPNRKDKVNNALVNLQKFSDAGGTMFQSKSRATIKDLHMKLKKGCEQEADFLRALLTDIEKLKQLQNKEKLKQPMKRHNLMAHLAQEGASLPLWIGNVNGFPPPSVGAIQLPSSSPLKQGDAIAALIKNNWCLAEIFAALPGGKFQIKDIDDDADKEIILDRNCVIPLPKYRADPQRDRHALFPKNAEVLALYPQTTCFYRGVINAVPETALEMYTITFEDSTFESGYSPPLPIHQRYVVVYRPVPDNVQ